MQGIETSWFFVRKVVKKNHNSTFTFNGEIAVIPSFSKRKIELIGYACESIMHIQRIKYISLMKRIK